MMTDEQVGRVDQVTRSCPVVWQKGVAPCFPHQISGGSGLCHPSTYCVEGGKDLLSQGDGLSLLMLERLTDRTHTGPIWTAKTSWGELSIRNASESSFKGQV